MSAESDSGLPSMRLLADLLESCEPEDDQPVTWGALRRQVAKAAEVPMPGVDHNGDHPGLLPGVTIAGLIERLRDEQQARCAYGTRAGDGRTCDCKFGATVFGLGGEITGCPELRFAISALTEGQS